MMSDDPIAKMGDLLADRLGLHFPSDRRRDLEQGLARAAREGGHRDGTEFARWFLSEPATRRRLDTLARHLTIGETHFFRHPEMMAALDQRVLPELIQRRQESGRYLRIWSAGCCTGEEPYTIAMLLDQLIPDQRDWRISILATDLNPAALRKADAGVYGQWSFRGTSDRIMRRYFRKLPGNRWELLPEIRSRVEFRTLNLAENVYPSCDSGTEGIDLILCRNVLMYFTPQAAREAAGRFHRCLSDGGWLATSPAEASRELFAKFETVSDAQTILFRRSPTGTPTAGQETAVPTSDAAALTIPTPKPPIRTGRHPAGPPGSKKAATTTRQPRASTSTNRETSHPRSRVSPRSPASPEKEAAALSKSAKELANQGRLDEAIDYCSRAIEADRLDSSYRYLKAVIELERGNLDEAGRALTQAVYLEPRAALPHIALGNLRQAQRRFLEAERHFASALRLLEELPADEQIAESDGLTAGQLTHLVEAALVALNKGSRSPGIEGRTAT